MRPRQQQWRVAIALMLASAATLGQIAGSAHSHPALADAAANAAAPAPPAPPAAPVVTRQAPPPPPVPQYTPPPPPVKHGPAPPGVVATVNGQNITTKQLSDEAVKMYGSRVLDSLIIESLIGQEAAKEHASATDVQIDGEVDDLRQHLKQTQPGSTLEQVLETNHTTLAAYRENLRLKIDAENLLAKTMKPPVLVHIKRILVPTVTPGGGPGKPPHTEAEAQAILAKAQADLKAGKSWDDVAKTYSEDPATKDTSGDLGIIGPGAPMDPALVQAALALKPGQVSDPVKGQIADYLIEAVSTSDKVPTDEQAAYAAAQKAYEERQFSQQIQAYIQQLRGKANIIDYTTP